MRVKLKYADEQTFIEKFGAHVTRNGIFLATRSLKPPGTIIRFELQLADGRRIMRGEGVVSWKRDPDPDQPHRAPGMGLRYTKLDADSRALIERIAAHRAASGQVDEHGDEDDDGVPQAGLQTGESGAVALPTTGFESGPVSTITDAAANVGGGEPASPPHGIARGSSPGLASAGRAPSRVLPELAALVPAEGEDDADVRALIDEDDGALDHVLERARRIAQDARGPSGTGSNEDQLLRALDALLTPGPIDAALASIETASQALATILGAAAPERRRFGSASRSGGNRSGDVAHEGVAALAVAALAEPRPLDPTPLPLGPTPTTPAISRPIRRTQPPPPPPPPRRSSPTMPPAGSSRPSVVLMPSLATAATDEVTREVSLAALAEADAALATGVQHAPEEPRHDSDGRLDGDFGSEAGADATGVSPPTLLRDILADDVSTGIELEAAPLPAPPGRQPAPPSIDTDEPHTRTAAALAAFALEASELDALAPGAGRARARRHDELPEDEVDVDLDGPDLPGSRAQGHSSDDDAEQVDDGALLEIDPDDDSDESETTGVSGITPNPGGSEPFDDLNAALDAALDLKLDGEDLHDGDRHGDGHGNDGARGHDGRLEHDPDEVPTAASRAPLPPDGRLPGSNTSPPNDGGETTVGEDGQPRKRGFFSKIFKK